MNTVAIIGEHLPAGYDPLIHRVCELLHRRGMTIRAVGSPLGHRFMEFFEGGKYLYWPDDGNAPWYAIDPKTPAITKHMIKAAPAAMRLRGSARDVAHAVTASILGLDPERGTKATFSVILDDSRLSSKVAIFLANKQGCEVINLTDRNEVSKLALKLKF